VYEAKNLKLGQGICGPEFRGCVNSGVRPAILKSKKLKVWGSRLGRPARYAVGPELYLHDAIQAYLINSNIKRVWKSGSQEVRFFKTSASARRYFKELCDRVLSFNQQDAERERGEREEIKRVYGLT